MLVLSLLVARADFYHPVQVAEQSGAFREASTRSADAVSRAQADARAYAGALREFEESLDLLGSRAAADQRERLAALEKRYNRDFASVQVFADDLVTGFDRAFQDALARALTAHPGADRCAAEIPDGPKLPGMRQRTKPNPECRGADLNAGLAAAMDADAQLRSELDALLSRPWPSVAVAAEPVAATGERWIATGPFFRAQMGDVLRDIQRVDEDERLDFEVAIEQGASTEERKALIARAREIDARTARRRAAAAEAALDRADAVFAKKAPDGGWCAQPTLLGGCVGAEAPELAELLAADKKFARAVLP